MVSWLCLKESTDYEEGMLQILEKLSTDSLGVYHYLYQIDYNKLIMTLTRFADQSCVGNTL
jgi:hypothetical protein